MTSFTNWQQRIGFQRDWVWQGWQTRYTYVRATQKEVSSTPIILVHGFGASIEHWRNNLPALSEQHTVYALDLLGFGASKKAPISYRVELWVEQVYDFWQQFIGQPVVLVGNSIGALVCLAAATAHPEMVKGLSLLSLPDLSLRQDAIPSWLQPGLRALEGMIMSPLLISLLFKVLSRPGVVRRWASLAYAESSAITEELVEILCAPAQDEGSATTFHRLFRAMSHPQFAPAVRTILPNLKIPVLLVWGQKDRMIPHSLAHQLADLNSQIELVELENAGHCPHDECPTLFNAKLLHWLETSVEKVNSSFLVTSQE